MNNERRSEIHRFGLSFATTLWFTPSQDMVSCLPLALLIDIKTWDCESVLPVEHSRYAPTSVQGECPLEQRSMTTCSSLLEARMFGN